MQVSFRGSRLKIKRAYKHIEELETWLRDLVQSNINTAMSHKDQNPGSENDTITIQRPVGFSEDVALIVGDAVHNLRAALDHIATGIIGAGITSGAIQSCEIETTDIYFPLRDTRETLVKTPTYALIDRVAPDLAAIICDVVMPNMAGEKKLWGLNHLDRMDKHRLLIPTLTESGHLIVGIREDQEDNPPSAPPGAIFMLMGITAADGTVTQVARAPRIGTRAYIHNQRNGYPSIEIKFGKGEAFEDNPIIPTLRELAELVGSTIDKLEARCE
jgi:hypothetical protein